jgi:hypothetical protein
MRHALLVEGTAVCADIVVEVAVFVAERLCFCVSVRVVVVWSGVAVVWVARSCRAVNGIVFANQLRSSHLQRRYFLLVNVAARGVVRYVALRHAIKCGASACVCV